MVKLAKFTVKVQMDTERWIVVAKCAYQNNNNNNDNSDKSDNVYNQQNAVEHDNNN